MNLTQWNKKGWPFLNDLELEEIVRFRLPQSRLEAFISDPDYIVSYYFVPDFYVVFPSWHGLRKYNSQFMIKLRKFVSEDKAVDDIGVLLEKNSNNLLYNIDNEIIRIKQHDYSNDFKIIRDLIRLEYSKPKLVDSRMLSVWRSKTSNTKSKKTLLSVPAHPSFKASKEFISKSINNISIALDLADIKKFQVSWESDKKILKFDIGSNRMFMQCQ